MKKSMKTQRIALVVLTAFFTGIVTAGDVIGLTSFTSGSKAKASEVNGNFTVVKTAVDDNNAKTDDNNAKIVALEAEVTALEAKMTAMEAKMTALEANSVLQLDGKLLLSGATTAQFSGVNVQVVDGTGTTLSSTGLGNLIVGYDRPRIGNSDKTGSHNLVVGNDHNYSSYGGFVAGISNTVSAPYVSVSGGRQNKANGAYASVSGGELNEASGLSSSVSGGKDNEAKGYYSNVSGGLTNYAGPADSTFACVGSGNCDGMGASINGGTLNKAYGYLSNIGGGSVNTTWILSNINGGTRNSTFIGENSSIGGGADITLFGTNELY